VVTLLPRFRPGWPAPGAYDTEHKRTFTRLGAPGNPLPQLLVGGKPICAATVRAGAGFLEVPFFATQETKRNRGYGRALLEAIEDIARAIGFKLLLLCRCEC
jgi:GNAT superfamily N-acetyltransferase